MELAAVHAEADESRRRAETALAEARAAERRLAEGLAASQSAVEAQLSHLSSEYEHIIATLMERHGESAGVGGGGGEGRQVEGAASVPAASAAAVAASAAASEAVDAIATPSKVLGTAAAATAAAVRSAGLPSRRSVTPSSTRLSLGEWMAGTSSGAADDDPSAVPSALVVEVDGAGAVPGIPGRPGSARPGAPYRAPPPPDPDGGFPTPFSPSPSLASRSHVRSLVRDNENPSTSVAGGAPNMAPSEAGTADVPVSAGVGRVSPAMETARLWSHIKEMESELSALELAHKREASEASHLRFRLSLLDETHSELEELYDLSEQV